MFLEKTEQYLDFLFVCGVVFSSRCSSSAVVAHVQATILYEFYWETFLKWSFEKPADEGIALRWMLSK
jgi:hypothetical protein